MLSKQRKNQFQKLQESSVSGAASVIKQRGTSSLTSCVLILDYIALHKVQDSSNTGPCLEGNHGVGGEGFKACGHVGIASWRVDGADQAVREETAGGVGVTQEEDVQNLLGRAGKGAAVDVCGDEVQVVLRHLQCRSVQATHAMIWCLALLSSRTQN